MLSFIDIGTLICLEFRNFFYFKDLKPQVRFDSSLKFQNGSI